MSSGDSSFVPHNAGGMGTWKIKSKFAVATWDWTDEGFKIKGCCY